MFVKLDVGLGPKCVNLDFLRSYSMIWNLA